ncbi:MAG: 1-deoxy-D-xylulose-5-phosphate reductoisomerase [Planctomycetota bacterium]|nr:1-deoxy-D-xylulose-5-phosphate reductoisomerase [Planctomycetota bacterium]MDA1251901.1 1-deoxy-D-xylulose-5-phosphate reductoisomerase [Planctomycetota bacterium]
MKRVAVLGSTGSIGTSSLEVLSALSDRLTLVGATAHSRWELLAEQTQQFAPRVVVVSDASLSGEVDRTKFHPDTQLRFGREAVAELASSDDVDIVVTAIVGAAGLEGTWAAVEAGKTIALANKETLIVAGPLICELAKKTGSQLLPVDSEHSAIFQALKSGKAAEVKRIILTASGGPFRGWTRQQLESASPEDALRHPTWDMGPKITIDSATLMNKALEVIEAKWLFDVDVSQIEVVVHPQSLVHSLVEFTDGSCIAQLSPPDMKLPIQYALTWPDRFEGSSPKMDWTATWSLDFAPPDRDLFPALDLGFEVARRGGSCGAVLNAANEVAVSRFLKGDLKFNEIPQACREILDAHNFDPDPTLTDLTRLDQWARQETLRWTSSPSI